MERLRSHRTGDNALSGTGKKYAGVLATKSEEEDLPAVQKDAPAIKTVGIVKRQVGKRANSDYTQVTAYIKKDTHKRYLQMSK